MAQNIHPSAHVDPKAKIGADVEIGPLCVIGPDVVLHDRVRLVAQVNIAGQTEIGADTVCYPFVSLGHPPQDFKHKGGDVRLIIGERNTFRELVNIHPGTDAGRRDTVVGDDCYFMVGSHLAHEGHVGNNVVFSNGVQVGGCVTIGNNVIMGGLSAVHQYTRIGDHAFVGGMACVTTDVIPYGSVVGNFAHLAGLNVIGLRRRGFDRQQIRDLRSAYRLLFADEGTFKERLEDVSRLYSEHEQVEEIVRFIKEQEHRPICMPHTGL